MNKDDKVNRMEASSLNVIRSRRWLLKSSAGLTAAVMATPILGAVSAEAEAGSNTVVEPFKRTSAVHYDDEIVGGI
jgi:hypothetical protein